MPVHRLAPQARCVLHTHMPYATALTMLENPRLEMAVQTALGFYEDIAYDGITTAWRSMPPKASGWRAFSARNPC